MDPDQDLLQKMDRQEVLSHLLPMAVASIVAATIAVFCYLALKNFVAPGSNVAFDAAGLVFLAASGLMAIWVQRFG